jgi:hypothetical protein
MQHDNMHWNQLEQERLKHRAPVNTVINIILSEKTENIVTISAVYYILYIVINVVRNILRQQVFTVTIIIIISMYIVLIAFPSCCCREWSCIC